MSFFYSNAPVDDDILHGWEFDSYDGRYYRIHPKRHCAPFPRPVPSYQQSDHVRPLYVKFLDGHIDEYLLECMFSPFGTVTGSRICRNWYGRSKGFGFVWFANDQEAADAGYWMDGRPIEGTELYVAPAEHWEDRQARLAAESGREDDDWFDEDDDYYDDEDWYDDDEFFEEDNPVYCDDRNYNGNNQWNQRGPSAPNDYYDYGNRQQDPCYDNRRNGHGYGHRGCSQPNYTPGPAPKREHAPKPVQTTANAAFIATEPRGPPPTVTACCCGTCNTPAQKLKLAPAGCAAA